MDKEDSGFDGHQEGNFIDQPGFGNARGGDRGVFDELAEAPSVDVEESWESRVRIESNIDDDGMQDSGIVYKPSDLFLEPSVFVRVLDAMRWTCHAILAIFCRRLILGWTVPRTCGVGAQCTDQSVLACVIVSSAPSTHLSLGVGLAREGTCTHNVAVIVTRS